MRKTLAGFLALILIVALAAPALAAEDDEYYFLDYYDWLEIWENENPALVEEILKDEPPLWAEWGYASLDELLSVWEVDEEYYYDTVLWQRTWDIYMVEFVAYMRVSMGGTSSGLAVMVNNRYISFPDAQPEYSNGRTMLPVRALMEALGATVDYIPEESVVTVQLKDVLIKFTVGGNSISIAKGNETRVIQMDCDIYIKDGRTYVPVRFFSEAAGYDVLWDSQYETAVILDKEAIINDLNKNFSTINKLYAMNRRDPSLTYKTAADISANITSFSTLDGNISAQISMKATIISNAKAQNMVLSCNLGNFLSLLQQRADIGLSSDELKELAAFSRFDVEIIENHDEQVSYVKFPALMTTLGYNKDAWLKIDGAVISSDSEIDVYPVATFSGADSAGAVIYSDIAAYDYYGVYTYDTIFDSAKKSMDAFGDRAFTVNGNSRSLHIDREAYELLTYGAIPENDSEFDYKELDVALTITDNAGRISASGSFTVRENTWGYGADSRTTGTFSMGPDFINASFTVHVDNDYKADVEMKISVSETTQSVAAAPPSGSSVITLD